MSNAILPFIVRLENGSVDQDATMEKFSTELSSYCVQRDTEDDEISRAVNTVFDRHPGANINLPALQSLTCATLNTPATGFKLMSERVASFIRTNSGEGGAYQIKKGKGGGVCRLADQAK